MGRDETMEHDLRYDRADEFMEVVLGHWDTWEDDAIVQTRRRASSRDRDKVHRLDHQGRFFRSRGPFTVPRSPQGHPVSSRPAQSGRGKRFAARWGEVIFVVYPNIEIGKRDYAEFKADVARCGRDPEQVKVTHLVNTVAAATKAEAEDKWALIEQAAARDRRAVAAVGGAELRLRHARAWTRRSPTRSWPACPGCRACATAWCR